MSRASCWCGVRDCAAAPRARSSAPLANAAVIDRKGFLPALAIEALPGHAECVFVDAAPHGAHLRLRSVGQAVAEAQQPVLDPHLAGAEAAVARPLAEHDHLL